MKCDEIESLIYLYNELDEQERYQVDTHVKDCASCKTFFVTLNNQHSLIQKASELPISAAYPERIKRNIMQVVERSNRNWMEELFSIATSYWLRASLAVASILLAGFFFVEFSTYSRISIPSTNATSSTYLNTSKFLKAHMERRESTNQVSFYDCLKQSDCDFLKNLKPNKNL